MICTCLEHCSSSSAPVSPLLKICPEIRNIILEDLLLEDEPMTNDSKSFYPEILAVCKQLNLEGSSILYSNTITWTIGNGYRPKLESRVGSFHTGPFPEGRSNLSCNSVREKLSKVCVVVFWDAVQARSTPITQMHDLALAFRKAPGWKHLRIDFRRDHISDDVDEIEEMLRPLQYLRFKTVELIGVPDTAYIDRLFDLITSRTPVVDLAVMYDKLREYVSAFICDDNFMDDEESKILNDAKEKRKECRAAVNIRDVDEFRKAREELLEMVACLVLLRQKKVFESDLNSWHPSLKLGIHDSTVYD